MIRLKQILEGKESLPNILFITDDIRQRRIGFARELISRRVCTGDIYTADKASIYELRELANTYVSSYYDLVVVVSRGLYETENTGLDDIITDYEKIITQCHQYDIPIVLSTLPTNKFINDKFKKEVNIPRFNISAINNWIRRNSDYILDTDQLLDDTYFDITGITLDREAHKVLYNQMLKIIKDIDPSLNIDSEKEDIEDLRDSKILLKPGDSNRHVATIQSKLIELGYDISQNEISNRKFGKTTTTALIAFKMKHGLNANDVIDKQTLIALQKAQPEKISLTADDEKRAKYAQIDPPKSVQEFFNLISGPSQDQELKYGIPASITMAQAALESGWGKSELAYRYNNYFGVMCGGFSNCVELTASDGKLATWRVYDNILDSFEDHSKVLKADRYADAFTYPISDYENWAKAIEAGNYAGPSTSYADTLIKLIEQYGLNKYVSDSDGGIISNLVRNVTNVGSTLSGAAAGAVGAVTGTIAIIDPPLQSYLKLPLSYTNISSLSKYRRKNEKLKSDDYFIVHHTGGRGTPQGVIGVLNSRNLGIQWIVDRDGKIYQSLPLGGRGAHILNSDLGPNNSNSQGVEVIAKDDSDVLPIQAAAVFKLVKSLGYSPNQIYGHGVVNPPPHRAANEGATIVKYIKDNWNTKI